MEIKEKQIQKIITQNTYIAKDGTEFDNPNECIKYEASIEDKNKEVFKTAISGLYNLDERPMTLYNIKTEEDWEALSTAEWYKHHSPRKFPGAGRYLAIREYYPDCVYDEYSIIPAEEYLNEIKQNYDSIYSAYVEINT